MRAAVVGLLLALAVGCGGGDSPPSTPFTPSAPTAPAAPTTPSEWTLAGQVVTTLSAQPVVNAVVAAGELSVTTDVNGRFELRRATALTGPIAVSVSADGVVTRNTYLTYPRSTPLVIDVIANRSPFDLGFYRQLARDGYEHPEQLTELYHWTRGATFYVRTVEDSGRPVDSELLDMLRRELPAAFAYWTDGHYQATVEEGTEDRTEQDGLVRVSFYRSSEDVCATATIGGNYGWIRFNVGRCGCGSVKVTPNVAWHEVGHIAGFRHVPGKHLMNREYNDDCGSVIRKTDIETWHARIAYARPFANTDPDHDPDWYSRIQPGIGPKPVVSCR